MAHQYCARTFRTIPSIFRALLMLFSMAGCGTSTPEPQSTTTASAASITYNVRVQSSSDNRNIANAKVTVEISSEPPVDDYADTNGFAQVSVDGRHTGKAAHVIIEAQGFKPFDQRITIQANSLPDVIKLEPNVQQAAIATDVPATQVAPTTMSATTVVAVTEAPAATESTASTTPISQQTTTTTTPASSDNTIAPGQNKTGSLAQGATVSFSFTGNVNTPLLFTVEVANNISYKIQITDEQDFKLKEWGNYASNYNPVQVAFTPPADGTYVVQLVGTNEFGSYNLKLEYISGASDTRSTPKSLDVGSSVKGNLAVDAIDAYSFPGSANTPVLFTVQVEGRISYRVIVKSPTDDKLVDKGAYASNYNPVQVAFTPPADGTYVVQLVGTDEFGSYNLKLEYISGASDTRNTARSLEVGSSVKGNLAVDATDSYSFAGSTNTPVLFTVQVEGEISYRVIVKSPTDDKLVDKGAYASNYNPVQVAFTPPADGIYVVQLVGTDEFGSYVLGLSKP